MKMFKTASALLVTASLSFSAMANHHKGEKDIVDTAASDSQFSTLVAAVKAAGLVDTLKGEGPYTVFAPTNDAFEALPEGTLGELLMPENKDKLVEILTYHVVADEVMASEVVEMDEATSVEGAPIDITATSSEVMVNDAKVMATDIEASNGVIHVIDKVIMPAEMSAGL